MKLTFLGATGTVTGSKYLLEKNGKKILIDCGLFQGQKELRLRNREPFPVDPKTIEKVLLTHAHLDHTGYIPLLVKQGFRGKIYATRATCDLVKILLLDAGRIQEEDARHANRHGYSKHTPALPLYTEEEARKSLEYLYPIDFDAPYVLGHKLVCTFSHSGHILGSSFITLKDESSTLVFSGDLGRPQDPIVTHPVKIEYADYLVLESTYGARLHSKTDVLDLLDDIINKTFSKGGSVVIPAFAVGRTQIILYYLNELKKQRRLPSHTPIYLDSPMAQDATRLWRHYACEHRFSHIECGEICSVAKYVQTREESKKLDYESRIPSIIISASGMAEGGRVLYHIEHYGTKPENTILFAGYQAKGTRGDRLFHGEREIKIHGHMIPIRARIENLDLLSSHADYEEILQWLEGFKKAPKEVFLTHGEEEAALSLQAKIEAKFGWKVTIPKYKDTVELDTF